LGFYAWWQLGGKKTTKKNVVDEAVKAPRLCKKKVKKAV